MNHVHADTIMLCSFDVHVCSIIFQALWKFIQPASNGSETDDACRDNLNDCSPSETANIVTEFANSNTAFLEAFGPAFQVLIENGYSSSELTEAVETAPDSAMLLSSTVWILLCLVGLATLAI